MFSNPALPVVGKELQSRQLETEKAIVVQGRTDFTALTGVLSIAWAVAVSSFPSWPLFSPNAFIVALNALFEPRHSNGH